MVTVQVVCMCQSRMLACQTVRQYKVTRLTCDIGKRGKPSAASRSTIE